MIDVARGSDDRCDAHIGGFQQHAGLFHAQLRENLLRRHAKQFTGQALEQIHGQVELPGHFHDEYRLAAIFL
ncbi:hypothetical protein D3C79_996360 [compost metagenome]